MMMVVVVVVAVMMVAVVVMVVVVVALGKQKALLTQVRPEQVRLFISNKD